MRYCVYFASDVFELFLRCQQGFRMVPEPNHNCQLVDVDRRMHFVRSVSRGFESPRYRSKHLGLQISMAAIYGVRVRCILCYDSDIQWILCFQPVQRR